MHFAFILLNLESQDLRKYFQYIGPVSSFKVEEIANVVASPQAVRGDTHANERSDRIDRPG